MEKQFIAEVKILGGIWHNNIVKLLCCIRGKTTKLLVYEYMDKQCLHKWLHGKKKGLTTQVLNWETRLKIAIGAAQGLCYMHHDCSPPIVHRDIKSSNILVDSDFNVKIADFGLAKMMASEGDPETASAIVGTFGYIARNHIYHGNAEYSRTRKVDAKSDIYSFGVVLSELTTEEKQLTGNEDMNLRKTTKLLVYEYMDKQCLHKWLHGKKKGLTTQVLNWETRLKIAIGAAQGLCYMHHDCSPPIVHRDIKSSNILVDSDFNVKIADFGLAKMMASEGDPETASAIVEPLVTLPRNTAEQKSGREERHLQFWRSTLGIDNGKRSSDRK
ncbi:PREDICTED: receptor-like protein kinase 5 [Ipomoea nil]|uniref:receptor-like protein kinase 5 n=1 Tax=Ipomoea nil TaxID=35883 RepID=UPI00090178D9|nr:PREDICTED: receptor-like protein kinase 5 [Ipomoea nil]